MLTVMIPDECSGGSLEGKLLLASPVLMEPTFHRAVILISNYNREEGALGFILNRPLGKNLAELLSDDDFARIGDLPVHGGGPVASSHLTFAAFHWKPSTHSLECETHLSASDAIRQYEEGFILRAFVGYSGWSAGQLENELEQGAWEVKPAGPEVADAGECGEGLWAKLVRDISPLHRLEADLPDDLSLN